MFVGPPGSGKSSLMDRLLNRLRKRFSASTGVCDSIVVVDIKSSTVVDIDKANPSTFHSVTVIDTNNTWEEIDCSSSFIRQIKQGDTPFSGEAPLPIPQEVTPSGTEFFVSNQPVSKSISAPKSIKEEIHSVIKKYGRKDLNWLKNTSSLYLRDTGGQVEFQEMLALLIHGPSIFIFVFRADLAFESKFKVQYRKSINESLNIYTSSITTEEALLQSLASVYAMDTSGEDVVKIHQPLVFIVATHIDKLGNEKEATISRLNQRLHSAIKNNGFSHIVQYADERKDQVMFEVDNTSANEDSFRLFRSRMNSLVNHHSHFSIEYPVSYLFFCLELQEIKKSILTLEECTVLAAKHGIIGENKVLHLLRFLHIRIGLIRHYDVAGIRHIIVREPQVLFKKTTDLIIKTFSSDCFFPGQITDFEKKGILTASVLESVMTFSDEISPRELLQLLVHLRITAPFLVGHEERYFFPCVLNHVPESTAKDSETDITPLCVTFKCNHCPKGIFGVLVTHLMRPEGVDHDVKFTLLEDKIFRDQVSFEVDIMDEVVLKLLPSHLEIGFLPDSSDDRDSPIKEICNNVREVITKFILKSLKDLHYKKEKVKPEMCFKCEHCSELDPVIKGKEHFKIKCRKSRKTGRIPSSGRCWYNEDADPPTKGDAMSPSPEKEEKKKVGALECLKKYRTKVEKAATLDMTWLAHEMNANGLLSDPTHCDVTNPRSVLSKDQKANEMIGELLTFVEINSHNLHKFVDLMRKKTIYADIVELLDGNENYNTNDEKVELGTKSKAGNCLTENITLS